MKKILVIGGAGYVGSVISRRLIDDGYIVMVFDDLSVGRLANLPMENPRLSFYEGSICDKKTLSTAMTDFQPDTIFHMAAIHYIPQCIENPEKVIEVNVNGTQNIVSAVKTMQSRPKLIFTSSASVYGAVTPAPQCVTDIPQPCDIYGHSKMMGEHIVSSQCDDYIIARLFNVFGDSDPTPHLIPSIVRQLDQETIELGNSDSARDFIHVEDAARAFIALAEQGVHKRIYNIGSGVSHSVSEVTQLLKVQAGSKADFVFKSSKRRKIDPKILRANISEIKADTGWQPAIDFAQGLKTVL